MSAAGDNGLLSGLASGLNAGLDAFNQAQDRQFRIKQYQDELEIKKLLRDQQERQISMEQTEKGLIAKPEGGFEFTPEMKVERSNKQGLLKAQTQKAQSEAQKAQAEATEALAKAKNPSKTRTQLPPDKVLSVNEGNVIPSMLQDIHNTIQANKDVFGPTSGRLAGLNPYDTKAQTIQSQVKAASQAFGRYMEGGVLRKEDEEKYAQMFPQLSDTPEVAAAKLQNVDRLLKSKQSSNVEALGNAGYNVDYLNKGYEIPEVPDVITQKRGLLNQNPNVKVIGDKKYKKVQGGWEEM